MADDHPLVTEMLGRVIESDPRLELAGTCVDGHAALEAITRLDPHVAVLVRGAVGGS